jgi:3-oxoacyl-[acyl-carrier protein] reductase
MNVLVTGGSGGLGSEVCARLCADRHAVAIGCHTNRVHAENLARELEADGATTFAIAFDVTDETEVAEAMRVTVDRLGGLDALVLAAAVNHDALLGGLNSSDAEHMNAVNVEGVIRCVRSGLPWLFSSTTPRIVTFSSILARTGVRGAGGYSATKAAVESITRSLAVELGPKGIRVNAVAPGFINAGLGKRPSSIYGEFIGQVLPLRRVGTADDVAAVVSFLLSDAASYLTGAVLPVDGGLAAGAAFTHFPYATKERKAAP